MRVRDQHSGVGRQVGGDVLASAARQCLREAGEDHHDADH
jgi:hypothetical protein